MKSQFAAWTFEEPYQSDSNPRVWLCHARRPDPLVGGPLASTVTGRGTTADEARDAAIFEAGRLSGEWDRIAWETARVVMGGIR